jgi:ParB-like chromosome segregation protein Spo0J
VSGRGSQGELRRPRLARRALRWDNGLVASHATNPEGVPTTSDSPVKTTEKRKLAELKPHPRQAANFRASLPHEVGELADDLKRNGQLCPVECLPDGTLIGGHALVAAAKLLGWQQVDVWVRHDLAAQGADASERRLIEDDLTRRHLPPLELARCDKRLKEMGRRGGLCQQDKAELRDQIGKKLGMSGRNLDRYLRVLDDTPQEVQDAVSSGKLAVTLAEKVASLPRAGREKVAAEIRSGEDPSEVVCRHVRPARTTHKKTRDAFNSFMSALARGVPDLEGRLERANVELTPQTALLLNRAESVIGIIRDRAAATAAAKAQAEAAP